MDRSPGFGSMVFIDFDQNPFKGGSDSVHNPVFDYKTGSGNDGVNMEVSGYIAADRDFKMNIDTGEDNDHGPALLLWLLLHVYGQAGHQIGRAHV